MCPRRAVPNAGLLVAPPREFSGSFSDFYHKYVEPNLPSPEVVKDIHRALVDYLTVDTAPLYVIRKFGTYSLRGRIFVVNVEGESDHHFICGDNEPALWFYARAMLHDRSVAASFLKTLIQDQAFPIGLVRKSIEKPSDWHNWKKEGWEKNFSDLKLYHAHLLDAGRGLEGTLKRGNLIARMMRYLHPANHIPMPSHRSSRRNPDQYVHEGSPVDLSELQGIKAFIMRRFSERYASIWQEFLALSKGEDVPFHEVENLQFRIQRVTTDLPDSRPPQQTAPIAPAVQTAPRVILRRRAS